MRVVALVSGGKDSCHTMLWCRAEGHQLVALANLQPAARAEMDSMMYQSVGHEAVHLYAAAMALPLFQHVTAGRAVASGKAYTACEGDEVEDLVALLEKVRAAHPDVEAVCSGAILSDYQRVRVENVCSRLGLLSLGYLWRRDQAELLREMAASGLRAILVKVASFGLDRRHLGRGVAELAEELIGMAASHQLNPCGEGGEYETFVLDSPLFRRPLRVVSTEEVLHSDDAFSPVAYLRLHLELGPEKADWAAGAGGLRRQDAGKLVEEAPALIAAGLAAGRAPEEEEAAVDFLTLSASGADAQTALTALMTLLESRGLSARHVVYMWLLLPDIRLYPAANAAYASFFPAQHPPCRACVQLPVRDVVVACLAVRGRPPTERSFMHVQSISHWAPANIGPYSQAVAPSAHWLLVSGQIGMRPADLSLPPDVDQALLSLRHAQVVVSAMTPHGGPTLAHLAWGICYGADRETLDGARRCFHDNVCRQADGRCCCPRWCFVQVPGLPKGAAVEWQPFLKVGGTEAVTVRRFCEAGAAVAALGDSRKATWVLCSGEAVASIQEAATEAAVVMPVERLMGDDDAVACVVTM